MRPELKTISDYIKYLNAQAGREAELKEHLKTAVGRLENLYRIIYGHVNNNEPMDNTTVYFAERFLIDTLKLLRDENGWTGRRCKVCNGTGEIPNHSATCNDCGGTGDENISEEA